MEEQAPMLVPQIHMGLLPLTQQFPGTGMLIYIP